MKKSKTIINDKGPKTTRCTGSMLDQLSFEKKTLYGLDDIWDMKNIHYCLCELQQVQAPQNSGMKNEEKEKLRRQKQGRRLQEINARRREEKVWFLVFLMT